MTQPLEEAYFNWLCAKVLRIEVPTPSLTYWRLLKSLHHTEFIWLVQGDDNRAEDGVALRLDFFRESFYERDEAFLRDGCSVLEMLIAFAKRAEFATSASAKKWFWEFLENLEIHDFNDSIPWVDEELSDILDVFIWRSYDYLGRGGLFPLSFSTHDQTEVELWYQFHEYLMDKEG